MLKLKPTKAVSFEAAMPVHAFERDLVQFKDGRVAVGFTVTPAQMEAWTPEDYTSFHKNLVGAMGTLPVGAVIQKTDIYYDKAHKKPKAKTTYYQGKMHEHFLDRLVLFQKSYLFISFMPMAVKMPQTNGINSLLTRAGQAIIKNPFAQLERTMEVAERHATEFVGSLQDLGDVSFERLSSEAIRELYLQYFNLNFDAKPAWQEREIGAEVGTIRVGEVGVNIVSMIGQGTECHPAVRNSYRVTAPMLYPLTHELQCPHILTQAMMVLDTREQLDSLDTDRSRNTMLSWLGNQSNELRAEQLEKFTGEIREGGKQIVSLHLSVVISDTSDTSRRENVERCVNAMRAMFGTQGVVESYLTLPAFYGLLPGNASQMPDRWLTTTADRAACYTHWACTYRSENAGEYMVDRLGNLVQVNLFNRELENQNIILVGPSGSGKSYAVGSVITQRKERRARQVILDVGGTYLNLMRALNGEQFNETYHEYNPSRPLALNPWVIPRDAETQQWEYQVDKLTFHLSLLASIWKGHNQQPGQQQGLSKSERAILARFLRGYYDYLNASSKLGQDDEDYPSMDSVCRYIKRTHRELSQAVPPVEQDDTDPQVTARREYQTSLRYIDMDQFFLVLEAFLSGGVYGGVLNARTNLDLSDQLLVCFDLARIQKDPDLYPIVAMLVVELVLDLFRKYPDDEKYLILDEAWSMLSGVLSEFIELMIRTIRKTEGAMMIITQGIGEIVKSAIGGAVIGNSETVIILRHTKEVKIQELQIALGLTDHELDLIRSSRKLPGMREFFIKQGNRSNIFAIEAAPEQDAYLTSKPSERNHLNRLIKKYQYTTQRMKVDGQGHMIPGPDGFPQFEDVPVEQLSFAVRQYIEDKRNGKVKSK